MSTVPPEGVSYSLDEAFELLATLEDVRDTVIATDHLGVLAGVEQQIAVLDRKLGFDER